MGKHSVIQLQTGHVIVASYRDTLAARKRVSLDGNGLNKRRGIAHCRLPCGASGLCQGRLRGATGADGRRSRRRRADSSTCVFDLHGVGVNVSVMRAI